MNENLDIKCSNKFNIEEWAPQETTKANDPEADRKNKKQKIMMLNTDRSASNQDDPIPSGRKVKMT
jgi:hypothetical protein